MRGTAKNGLSYLDEPAEFMVLSGASYQVTLGKRLCSKYGTAHRPTGPTPGNGVETMGKSAEQLCAGGPARVAASEYLVLTYRKTGSLVLIAVRWWCSLRPGTVPSAIRLSRPPSSTRSLPEEFAGVFKRAIFAISPRGQQRLRPVRWAAECSRSAQRHPPIDIQRWWVLLGATPKRWCRPQRSARSRPAFV